MSELLAPDAAVESNVPGRLLDTLGTLAAALDRVALVSETYTGGRALLVYDCVIREPAGTVRTAEALAVEAGRIRSVRLVYDLTALARLVPVLVEPG